MSDLLKNRGFEEEWAGSHTAVVVEGVVYEVEIGNIFTPPGWITWYDHRGDYAQPEVTEMHASQYPERVRSEAKAMRFFTFARRHDGGFFQHVAVEPGARVRLSAYAHAWSNHDIEGHESCFEDGACSAGVGRGGHALDEAPPLNGDPWNDAIGNFTFRVGIDPRGGDDPTSREIVWGPGAHIYNEFAPVPPVEAVAAGDRVTVFLRSMTLWPFKHNDAYWDDVSLEVVEGPPPEECRGRPRVQYARVYNVIPAGATTERAVEIFKEGWLTSKQTAGGSYDDAGVGDLDDRTAVLWDIDEDEQQPYADWYAEHYEGVKVQFAGEEGDPWDEYAPYLLWQADPAWADHVYADGSCWTLASQGCFITANAMAQRWYGIDPDATPVTVDLTVGRGGYANCCLLWSAMREKLGLDITPASSADAAREHLAGGDVVFIEIAPSSMMHFVMAVEHDGEDFVVLDPLHGVIGYLGELYVGAESFRLISRYEGGNGGPGRALAGVL